MSAGTEGQRVVYLHIGTPKSGTTYLQTRFEVNQDRAGQQGLFWPGPRWGEHVEAVRDLRTLKGKRLDPAGPWMRLVDSIRAAPGPRALISMEWMSGFTPTEVEVAVRSLAPARVEVICTCRDLLRTFVAQWQEMTKNCRPWSWQQFVDEMLSRDGGAASLQFWRQQDVPKILERWASSVPLDQIHLVTLPRRGADPEVLWHRFCSILGIDGSGFEQPPSVNESLGVVSANLMRRANLVAIDQSMDRIQYQRVLHRRLADSILAPHRDQEASIAVSPDVDRWIRDQAEQQIQAIARLGARLVGDLEELVPGEPLTGRDPSDVSDSELLELSVEAMVKLAMDLYEANRRLREQNRRLREGAGRSANRGLDG